MKIKQFIFLTLVLFVIAASSFACSSGGDESKKSLEAQATSGDAAGLEAAARLVAEGILEGSGDKVFAQISSSCQQKISRVEVTKQIDSTSSYLVNILGASLDDFSVEDIETKNVIENDKGQARYTILVKGKSLDALKKLAEESNKKNNSSTVGTDSTETTTTTLPFDKPTQWFDFVYEDSSWRLESCQEFLEAAILASPKSTTTTSK